MERYLPSPITAAAGYQLPNFVHKLYAAKRVWVVAAIFAQVDQLKKLHDQLGKQFRRGDRLVYTGNYCGHGTAARETIDELLQFRRMILSARGFEPWDFVYLRGGQEEMARKLLELQFSTQPSEVLDWILDHGGAATLKAYGTDHAEAQRAVRRGPTAIARWTSQWRQAQMAHAGHQEFNSQLASAVAWTEAGLLMVHAGIDPKKSLEDQHDAFWWGHYGFTHLDQPFEQWRCLLRGHDPARRGPMRDRHRMTIDGGCGFGGKLLATCVDSNLDLVSCIDA